MGVVLLEENDAVVDPNRARLELHVVFAHEGRPRRFVLLAVEEKLTACLCAEITSDT
jgi:hypothetical protein